MAAYKLAQLTLPDYSSKFSRKDFTLPQLFAGLVLREQQKKSYLGLEALLKDSPSWRAAIGLSRTPDSNTFWRAFQSLGKPRSFQPMLDRLVAEAKRRGLIRGRLQPVALDSTMFESHHVSRHFEKRQRQTARQNRPQDAKKRANRRRRAVHQRLPKLSLAVASASPIMVAARATTGSGGDQPFFEPLLREAQHRAKFRAGVADAGFDSEANHRFARQDLGVRSIIPPDAGRPTDKPASTHYRRLMQQRFARQADRPCYGQRWQAETVNSMLKRNLGSALRARTARRRSKELLLRVVTHNLMILAAA